jgi:hypothetical protein
VDPSDDIRAPIKKTGRNQDRIFGLQLTHRREPCLTLTGNLVRHLLVVLLPPQTGQSLQWTRVQLRWSNPKLGPPTVESPGDLIIDLSQNPVSSMFHFLCPV